MKKILTHVPYLWNCILGLALAALFAIVLPIPVPFFPVIFAVAIEAMIVMGKKDKFDWWNMAAAMVGALIIQLYVIIA